MGILKSIGIISIILTSSLFFTISPVNDYSVFPKNESHVSDSNESGIPVIEIRNSWAIPAFASIEGEGNGDGGGDGEDNGDGGGEDEDNGDGGGDGEDNGDGGGEDEDNGDGGGDDEDNGDVRKNKVGDDIDLDEEYCSGNQNGVGECVSPDVVSGDKTIELFNAGVDKEKEESANEEVVEAT